MMVSMVRRCYETETRPIPIEEIFSTVESGDHGLKERLNQGRNRYEMELALTGSHEKAHKAFAEFKNELPAVMFSGTFSKRNNASLVEYSGLLCADLDNLGDQVQFVKECLKSYPFIHATMVSASGYGLKAICNVVSDPARHEDSFRAIQKFFRNEVNIEIDEKCKDIARIHFLTYDPDIWVRTEGNEIIEPLPREPKPVRTFIPGDSSPNFAVRRAIAEAQAVKHGFSIEWTSETRGLVKNYASQELHGNPDGPRDFMVNIDGAPNYSNFHDSSKYEEIVLSKELQSLIGKAEKTTIPPFTIPYRDSGRWKNLDKLNGEKDLTPEKPFIKVWSPKELKMYVPPSDIQLIGDCHIIAEKGFTAVLGGPGGVGKSLSLNWLAICGALGEGEWFGMKIHRKFKTFIIQNENGPYRLSRNFQELDCDLLDEFVRITEPPEFGMLLRRDDFRKEIIEHIAGFFGDDVGIVAFDPFNSGAPDQEQSTYLDTFTLLKSLLPPRVALVIAHHLRKPQTNELSKGRSQMFLMAGSYVLTSVPRSLFVLQPASDDVEDDGVVFVNCKNNDGELGKRSAWHRRNGIFTANANFDWDTYDADSKDKRVLITKEMVEEVFEDGELLLVQARDKLRELSGASQNGCYKALSEKGRFTDNLIFRGKLVNWRRSPT